MRDERLSIIRKSLQTASDLNSLAGCALRELHREVCGIVAMELPAIQYERALWMSVVTLQKLCMPALGAYMYGRRRLHRFALTTA